VISRSARRRPEHWLRYARERDAFLCNAEGLDLTLSEEVGSNSVIRLLWQIAMGLSSGARVKSLHLIALSIDTVAADLLDDFEAARTSPDASSAGRSMAAEINNETSNRAEIVRASAGGTPSAVEIRPCPSLLFLTCSSMQPLRDMVGRMLLRSSDGTVRQAVSVILKSIVVVGSRARDVRIISSVGSLLADLVSSLSVVGRRGVEYTEVLLYTLSSAKQFGVEGDECEWVQRLGKMVGEVVRKSAKRIYVHPNAYIYKALATFISIDGFYLESEPCLTCCTELADDNRRELHRLDTLRAEAKFTDCAIFCRLTAAQSISKVLVKIGDPDKSRMVKRINFYHSVRSVADAAELKSREHPWRLSTCLQLNEGQCDAQIELDIPVEAANVMFEFASFHTVQAGQDYHGRFNSNEAMWSSLPTANVFDANGTEQNSSGGLQCPRCSRQVTDRYGICRSCGVCLRSLLLTFVNLRSAYRLLVQCS
jgi:hypothetical protein